MTILEELYNNPKIRITALNRFYENLQSNVYKFTKKEVSDFMKKLPNKSYTHWAEENFPSNYYLKSISNGFNCLGEIEDYNSWCY